MFGWLANLLRGKTWRLARRVRAAYDAARTTDDNRRHWANADGLSARAANSLEVRKKLRERSRYEFDNNGYCQGLILTLANDLVGTGPRLVLLTEDAAVNRQVELAFAAWWEAVGLTEKLHTLKQAKTRDGEAVALLTTNPELASPVQLDLQEIECDQLTAPYVQGWNNPSLAATDGIELDRAGNPIAYHILREHPGDLLRVVPLEYDRVPARSVIHWFRKDRPRQVRGVPEITASLPLFAQLRRYTLATLTAAETAADFAALLESDLPPDAETSEPNPFETLEIERGMMTTLPSGAKLSQLKAEQPTTTYPQFKSELLKEIGRPVNAPFNVVAGDSSPYNYSSARLDHLLYRGSMRVERNHCRRNVLERLYAAWLDEAVMVKGLLPAGITAETPHAWYWPGFESIDPQKEAAADTERLANGTTTLAELLAEYGQDWEAFIRQRARELDLMREVGITPPTAPAKPTNQPQEQAQ